MRKLWLGLLASAILLPAADFTGIWLGSLTSGRRNQVTDFAFHLVQKGTALSGKVYLEYGSEPITSGSVDGNTFTFTVTVREQAGNQIDRSVLKFTGVIQEDGQVELTREREQLVNAGNAGASFTPSPVIATTAPRSFHARTIASFFSGFALAWTNESASSPSRTIPISRAIARAVTG